MQQTLTIDPELQALIPPQTADEHTGLESSIMAEGCRESILVWDRVIIDGHNRYEICTRNNVPYTTREVEFESRAHARIWIRNNQLSRRNLSDAWKLELALGSKADLAEIGRAKLAEAGSKHQGNQHSQVEPLLNNNKGSTQSHNTRAIIAESVGMSPGKVAKAEYVKAKAPELWEKAKAGDATIGGAYTQAKREEKESAREERRQENAEKIQAAPDPIAIGARFTTLLIDPPWDWNDEGDVNQMGRAKPDYSTMPIAELMALDVAGMADEDSHLYMWVTNRSMPKAFALMEAWGFRYVSLLTWPKPSFGMGNYFRGQTEHLLFGVRGSLMLKRKDASTLLPPWNRGKGGHSSKPLEIYEFIESCSYGPYLELFSRIQREGWTALGESNAKL